MVYKKLDRKELGFRIIEARARLKLSVDEIADKAGLTRTAMYNYEGGKSKGKIYFDTLRRIANALEVDFMWLCYGDIDRTDEIRSELKDSFNRILNLPLPYQAQILDLMEMMDDHASSRKRKNDHYSKMSGRLS